MNLYRLLINIFRKVHCQFEPQLCYNSTSITVIPGKTLNNKIIKKLDLKPSKIVKGFGLVLLKANRSLKYNG